MARTAVLGGALALIGLLLFLTLSVLFSEGFDILVGVSIIVLAVLGFGVLGALASPSDE